ncbi:MAG: ParB/RepB/Spo0J family partition protein [Acidobacteria bacterium]|nr:ParB/RepB/Spo0J family partition protein [Acidobacteriota bacterium]
MSSPRRLGLPNTVRMRHDTHFVDQLARPSGESIGRLVPMEEIIPNPDQPRQTLGDLSDLISSIREKGVLEPLLVRKVGGRFQIIAGERRFRAAMEAGLDEVPCVVRESSDAEMMELALVENLQRKDLTPFEEADGLKVLADSYGYTHEMMAEKLGKSRSSVTETLALAAMPEDVRELCRRADIYSKSVLLQIVRQTTPEKMRALLERLEKEGTTRAEARRLAKERSSRRGRGRPRHYVFKYQPKGGGFALSLQFKKAQVPRAEVIQTLESILEELRREDR